MSIDRIDYIPGSNVLRLIDYKTGGDKIESGSIEQLFTDYTFGAIFQVMTYALAFIDNRPERIGDFVVTKDMDMCPQLYVFNKMQESGLPYINIGSGKQKKPVLKFAAEGWEADFRPLFVNMIDEIFNPEVPFYPKKDKEKNCLYCPFKDMCN